MAKKDKGDKWSILEVLYHKFAGMEPIQIETCASISIKNLSVL
jgi:hypothetical protein